ncbi:MAG: hypothetical protein F4202_05730 [Cenarchaeum sp. SB0677_bin_16]|nr:hypothetical protein [Cenarchaeum sp. SB0677_bin_16]
MGPERLSHIRRLWAYQRRQHLHRLRYIHTFFDSVAILKLGIKLNTLGQVRELRQRFIIAHIPNLGDRYRHIHRLALKNIASYILQKSGTLARAARQWATSRFGRLLLPRDPMPECARIRTFCPPIL